MLRRIVFSDTSMAAFSAALKCTKIVLAGWMAKLLWSKRFVARRMTFSLSMKLKQASRLSKSMVNTAPGSGPNCFFDNS